jgi:hypothetical protein
MAKKTDTTHSICAPGGPVSGAIRAVREPATPWFVPVLPDDEMRTGYHLARRHEWADPRRLELVWLEVWSDGPDDWFAIARCGNGKVEDPMQWEFCARVVGIDTPSEETLDLDAVDVSGIMH